MSYRIAIALIAFRAFAEETHSWSDFWNSFTIRSHGDIEFSDDDRDIRKISPGGYLIIEERRFLSFRTLEIRPEERSYTIGWRERPFDATAKAWLEQALPRVIRNTGAGAEGRSRRILAKSGPAGVLDEISRIESSGAKSVYFRELFASGKLDSEMLRRAARQIAREIHSDGSKARLLGVVAPPYLASEDLLGPYFQAVDSIRSDGEQQRLLADLLDRLEATPGLIRYVLKSAGRISSDGEKARILIAVAQSRRTADDLLRPNFFQAANTIQSDGERRRVLTAVLERSDLSRESMSQALR
ncbi:MAG: hypothetical protein ACRD96_29700, partial [Bryobacteraceae bacterium]